MLGAALQEDGLDLGLEKFEAKWRGLRGTRSRRFSGRRHTSRAGIQAARRGRAEHQQQRRSLGPCHPDASSMVVSKSCSVSVLFVPVFKFGIALKQGSKLSDVLHGIECKHALDQTGACCGAENGRHQLSRLRSE